MNAGSERAREDWPDVEFWRKASTRRYDTCTTHVPRPHGFLTAVTGQRERVRRDTGTGRHCLSFLIDLVSMDFKSGDRRFVPI